MKKLFIMLIFYVFSMLLPSCNNADKKTFTFPLQTGNSWEYTRIIKYTQPGSDSLSSYFPLPDTASVTMRIKDTRIFADTAQTYEFEAELLSKNEHYISTTFYLPLEKGLFRYAYKNPGVLIFPKQKQTGYIRFHGKTYSSISALLSTLESQSPFVKTGSDSLTIENPPPLVYKYPFKVGEQWAFIERDDLRIAKRVSGKQTLELDCGTFSCYTIEWSYDFDEDDEWDDDITMIDYLSEEGLIYRKLSLIGIVFTNENGDEVGSADYYETYTLTNFDL